jgi:serine/threonine-protein kinase
MIDKETTSLGERYVIEESLGEGSTGIVYRAVDRQLKRTVAVKVLRSRDPGEVARFQAEARAQASIDHEHICRVFDVGEIEGRAFIAMQLVNGATLRELAADLTLDEKVGILEQAARAVHAAHAGRVIHRDLKPGNIMVERRPGGGVHAVVLDFGIAGSSRTDGDDAPVMSSGTPAFMAPEQVRREKRDHRMDVYGLGATLYGVLAEQAPFFGETRTEVEHKVLRENPVRLGLVVPGIPVDLDTIVAVAMTKSPERRYPDARSLADDLGRWRRGEPIRARVAGTLYRSATWMKTRRGMAAVLGLTTIVLAAAVLGALWLRTRANQRQALIEWHQNEVEQIDRLLRRARMMPLHDTTGAESAARAKLVDVEANLLEHGPLVRGPAYYALGFGHLMLRDLETAEEWLQAAVDSGFSDPEVESALGIAQALRILDFGRNGGPEEADQPRIDDAVRHLSAAGPKTSDRDAFHRALGLYLEGNFDAAISEARESGSNVPWLYEASQLEGDILVARADRRRIEGDIQGAGADLRAAASAYSRGLQVARSDAWLYRAEAERLLRLFEIADADESAAEPLATRAMEAAVKASAARPGADSTAFEARVSKVISESHGANGG